MPRKSAEARGMPSYSSDIPYPEPPEVMSDQEKGIWRDIVNCKPMGWFDNGSLQLLEQYCGTAVEAKAAMADLRTAAPEDKKQLRKQLIHLNTSLATLATKGSRGNKRINRKAGSESPPCVLVHGFPKCRLSVQSVVDRRSKMLDEKGAGKLTDDRLLGGTKSWGGAKLLISP
jgi:hypothetical protein